MKKVAKVWQPECISHVCDPTASGLSVMTCSWISYCGVGSLAIVEGNMNSQKCIEMLEQYLEFISQIIWFQSLDLVRRQYIRSQVHPVKHMVEIAWVGAIISGYIERYKEVSIWIRNK